MTIPARGTPAPAVRLTGPRLLAARALWASVTALTVGLFAASLPSRYAGLLRAANGILLASLERDHLAPGFYAAYNMALEVAVALGFIAVALVIFLRKSEEWPALFVSLTLVAFGMAVPGTTYAIVSGQPIWDVPFGIVQALGWALLLIFAYLFPTGRFVPRWSGLLAAVWIVWVFCFFWLGHDLARSRAWLVGLSFVVWVGWFGTGVLAQAYRYLRVAGPEERQQTKWVTLGFMGAISGALVVTIPHIVALSLGGQALGLGYQLAATTIASGAALLIPIAIAIAILRHRLFDIDLLINRALVYGVLTGSLAIIYAACIIGLQLFFGGRISPQGAQNPLTLVVSTLATAALFQPLRRRIQEAIDQRFYRHKYDAARAIAAFGATLHQELDLAQFRDRLVGIVWETMQPEHISLWLRASDQDVPGRAPSGERAHGSDET